ncbi:glycogen debranching protein GlgX [Chitinophagaceae bacterium LB-8]|uniref:Glycogen debranching protein GlgX n=1 Tax=Paraflavisolibacter caeni TaxID=2982496 RepID=A0A9X3BHD7_9BACT|nr:glycogen debranching protein GlgX [Paraflavisolibacter caeni]MCU7548723.1 glycogen debranching protein GlgX [Paraflavisolibacter caeni]
MENITAFIQQPTENGECYPLGATLYPQGVNFSLFCKNGTIVELLLFDDINDIEPAKIIRLNAARNRTYHYWHTFVHGLSKGQLYAYQIDGPYDPENGHRYNEENILLDPYAHAIAVPDHYHRYSVDPITGKKTPPMKSVVADLSLYHWEEDTHLRHPFATTIIYELHVGGFTRHPNSPVEPAKKGTYTGLIEMIPYLVSLGITAVELMPVFQFDEQDCPPGLINYWGYSPVSFFAPHQGYSCSKDPLAVLDEFRDMVKAFHRASIEVILDVVFNHSAENGEEGPSYCFKGIDNSIYYILAPKGAYADYSGTGNTLNANQPIVRRMIIDSLHFWVTQMHVDGFRFDLASILSRDEKGHPIENPPVLWDIESDPVLAGVKLIAEAWDAAGLYQVGGFVGDSWKEWNGKFRDDVRRFFRGDEGSISDYVTRLVGSPDMYSYLNRGPEQSINFTTCHDGFTLNDLVSYNQKHNEANGEDNRDGNNDNLSWNCGEEGSTDKPEIEALRKRQIKNFLAATLLSIGTPMILMGDEVRRTQQGNNNAYCQNNEISWFDWSLPQKHTDLIRFVQQLIFERQRRDPAKEEYRMSLNQLLNTAQFTWHGVKLNQPDWSHQSHSIAFTVRSLSGVVITHYMLNAYHQPLEFEIPEEEDNKSWKLWIDTAQEAPDDIMDWHIAPIVTAKKYKVMAHTVVVLTSG